MPPFYKPTVLLPQMNQRPRVLIAGIAGASLGTEIAKSLRHAGIYDVFGCDVSQLAFGHYDHNFDRTFMVERENYAGNLLRLCKSERIDCLIPGGDQPAVLIGRKFKIFADGGVNVCQNNPELVARLSHKGECFKILAGIGVPIPATRLVSGPADLEHFPMPCIVKPATESGGSAFVFYAKSKEEAELYCKYLLNNGRAPVVQQYISEKNGEFTVGVLSLPDGTCAGAIALKRSFESKLSVAMRGEDFLISSGYSQGRIDKFPDICSAAIRIASKLGSTGPLNIQGRISDSGDFTPFEINPRFSASTYLRTLAGFNEVDYFVRYTLGHPDNRAMSVRPGWYLRTLSEIAVTNGKFTP